MLEKTKKVGSLVTMKSREVFLKTQVESLSPQFDELYVTLNGFDEKPAWINSFQNVKAVCDSTNSAKDIAKLLFASEFDDCHYFTLDDDIVYPPDYSKILSDKLLEYKNECVVCYHGTILKPNWKIYYNHRSVLHYHQELKQDKEFDLAGTATVAFHTGRLKIDFTKIWDFNIGSDMWIAYFAYLQGMKLMSIARPANWILCKPGTQGKGIPLFVKVANDKEWQWKRNRFIKMWKSNG